MDSLFPAQPAEGQCLLQPRHTGLCWFAGQSDYPDVAMLTARVKGNLTDVAEVPDTAFDHALAKSFLNMSRGSVVGEAKAPPSPYPYSYPYPYPLDKVWDTVISPGPSETMRQCMLESSDKGMMFMGSAHLEGIVALLEIATALAVSGVDLDRNSTSPGPWHYELICADNSATLGEAVETCRKEHEAPHWLACAHYVSDTMSFALFYAEDANRALSCTAEALLMTNRADNTRQHFRTVLFWRDATASAALAQTRPGPLSGPRSHVMIRSRALREVPPSVP